MKRKEDDLQDQERVLREKYKALKQQKEKDAKDKAAREKLDSAKRIFAAAARAEDKTGPTKNSGFKRPAKLDKAPNKKEKKDDGVPDNTLEAEEGEIDLPPPPKPTPPKPSPKFHNYDSYSTESPEPAPPSETPPSAPSSAPPSTSSAPSGVYSQANPNVNDDSYSANSEAASDGRFKARYDSTDKTVYVGWTGPGSGLDQDALHKAFSPFGQIHSIRMAPQKRCGFIRFLQWESAVEAMRQLTGKTLGPYVLTVSKAKQTRWQAAKEDIADHHPRPYFPPPQREEYEEQFSGRTVTSYEDL